MHKRHELNWLYFLKQHFQTYMNLLKNTQKMKMAESSRSISPIKKKVKRCKLAGTTSTKTIFKLNRKKDFLSSQAYQMMLQPVGDIVETAHITLFFCDIIKCAVFLLNMKFGRYLKVVNNKSIMFKLLITVGI